MRLSDFDYVLPKERIAQYPLEERDAAKLLVLDRKNKTLRHSIFKRITDYLDKDDLLVLNNTRVLPARLKGQRLSGGKVEILLLNKKKALTFNVLLKPSRLRVGEKIIFNGGSLYGVISARNEITFSCEDINSVYKLGSTPLPPYIKREPQKLDEVYYQTVYAKEEGAIASPTAGLHFTPRLMQEISSARINSAYITLHIGYSTFKPVKTEDITRHKMEDEYFKIADENIKLIENTRAKFGRIVAVGTTSCRALETYAQGKSQGHTDLFIYPGYKFKMVDCLLTNFHLPRTTLFLLVCAFGGEKLIQEAYQEAIDNNYRFYSYGDAMLIL